MSEQSTKTRFKQGGKVLRKTLFTYIWCLTMRKHTPFSLTRRGDEFWKGTEGRVRFIFVLLFDRLEGCYRNIWVSLLERLESEGTGRDRRR